MRYVTFLFAILFFVAAFFQVDGPQPGWWVLLCGIASLVSLLAYFAIYPTRILLFSAAFIILYGSYYFYMIYEGRIHEVTRDLIRPVLFFLSLATTGFYLLKSQARRSGR